MAALYTMLVVCAVSGVGETVLLDFSAPWCGPCRQMEPTIHRLAGEGYPVRQINIDQHRQLAAQYRVSSVPCFIMLAGGQEVDRVVGATSHARLARMFKTARFTPAAAPNNQVRSQSPDGVQRGNLLSQAWQSLGGSNRDSRQGERLTSAGPAATRSALSDNSQIAFDDATRRALQASVRLKIEDPRGYSYGTGTIIDVHGDEALVLTCGHIFRDSAGKGRITVELFAEGAQGPVAGRLIAYDAQRRDVGLVSIRPGIDVSPIQVGGRSARVARGDRVFSIGCDHGGAPSIRESKVTSLNRYTGPSNIEVAGRPVDGRSGGGLFSADGQLIGVCNLADPTDNEGIYAALETVHWQMDQIGHPAVYQRADAALARSRIASRALRDLDDVNAPPLMPRRMPTSPTIGSTRNGEINDQVGAVVVAGGTAAQNDVTEIICILRSKNDPQGGNRVFVVDQPSQDLLHRLSQETNASAWQPTAVLQASRVMHSSPASDHGVAVGDYGPNQVIRGQSSE